MANLPDGHFDVTITDPPYDSTTHEGARSNRKEGIKNVINFPPLTMGGFLAMARECVRVSKRWVVMTASWQHAALLDEAHDLVRAGVWVKPNAAPQFSGDRPGMGWEALIMMHRKGPKEWNGGGKHSVYTFNVEPAVFHPTGKPLPLIKRLVADFSNEGETVFDPYMGAGTTGVACVQLNRNFVGCEIDGIYFDTAKRRIAAEASQLKLFPYNDLQGDPIA